MLALMWWRWICTMFAAGWQRSKRRHALTIKGETMVDEDLKVSVQLTPRRLREIAKQLYAASEAGESASGVDTWTDSLLDAQEWTTLAITAGTGKPEGNVELLIAATGRLSRAAVRGAPELRCDRAIVNIVWALRNVAMPRLREAITSATTSDEAARLEAELARFTPFVDGLATCDAHRAACARILSLGTSATLPQPVGGTVGSA